MTLGESTQSQVERRNEAQRAHARELRKRARARNFLAQLRAARKRKSAQERIGGQVERSIARSRAARDRARKAAERGRRSASAARRRAQAAKKRAEKRSP